jgi:hypothetical protein
MEKRRRRIKCKGRKEYYKKGVTEKKAKSEENNGDFG